MSLIYDYLKIQGNIDSKRNSDVGIPPILARKDPKRHLRKTVLIILGSCVVAGLFIFLVVALFIPAGNVQIPSVSESLPPIQARPDTASVTPEPQAVVQQQEPTPSITAMPAIPAAVVPVPERISGVSMSNVIQVFPEEPQILAPAGAAATHKTPDMTAVQLGQVREKTPQTLELNTRDRKITFPEKVPVSAEARQSAVKPTEDIPFQGDVAVREAYQPGDSQDAIAGVPFPASRINSSAGNISYSLSEPVPAVPNKSKKLYQAGLNAQQTGDLRIAEIYYLKTLLEDPFHMEAMINLSALFVQQQRYAEAEKILADILKIDPGNSKALVNMGVVNLYTYNEPRAEELFQAALDANPMEENALINLAYLAEKRMDYVSAETYYRHLLQISPNNLEVLLAYGYLLEEGQRYTEAVAIYRVCLQLDFVKKDRQLYDKISQRMRLLAGGKKR